MCPTFVYRERLERPLVADTFSAAVRAERVGELGNREDALLVGRREVGLLEARHQTEVVDRDRALTAFVTETADPAMLVQHESWGGTGCEDAKRFDSPCGTANKRRQSHACSPRVRANDGDAVRGRFRVE